MLSVKKVGHLNIKTKMFNFEARVLIGRLANIIACSPIRMRSLKSNIFVFMLRWPTIFTASIFSVEINSCFSRYTTDMMLPHYFVSRTSLFWYFCVNFRLPSNCIYPELSFCDENKYKRGIAICSHIKILCGSMAVL